MTEKTSEERKAEAQADEKAASQKKYDGGKIPKASKKD